MKITRPVIEWTPKPGWLNRQFARIEKESKTWPEWMRRREQVKDFNIPLNADLVELAIDVAVRSAEPDSIVSWNTLKKQFSAILTEAARREREACAELMMEYCREFNDRASSLSREGRHSLADDRESRASQYARSADAIRARGAQ